MDELILFAFYEYRVYCIDGVACNHIIKEKEKTP